MAKSTKPKKEKLTEPVQEETKIETVEPIIETPEIGEAPPSVTLDEVKTVESLVVTEVIPEPKEVPISIPVDLLEVMAKQEPTPIKIINNNDDRSIEEKVTEFLDSRGNGEIKMNDFLKSLYGVPKFGEPPLWSTQGVSKALRATLDKMQKDGLITIQNNNHMKLATFYYPDNTAVTNYHNLNSVQIVAIK